MYEQATELKSHISRSKATTNNNTNNPFDGTNKSVKMSLQLFLGTNTNSFVIFTQENNKICRNNVYNLNGIIIQRSV